MKKIIVTVAIVLSVIATVVPAHDMRTQGIMYTQGIMATIPDRENVSADLRLGPIYEVQRGDSLWAIATKHNITVTELKRLNPQVVGDLIRVGDKLSVPGIDMGRLFLTFAYVESRYRCDAVGDGGKAIGPLQMWTIMVDEVNRIAGTSYTYEDRASWQKSYEMFCLIMRYRNVQTVADAVRVWNPRYKGNMYQEAYDDAK